MGDSKCGKLFSTAWLLLQATGNTAGTGELLVLDREGEELGGAGRRVDRGQDGVVSVAATHADTVILP